MLFQDQVFLRSILFCKGAFQVLLWQELAFSSPFCYSNNLSSILSSRGFGRLLSLTHHLVLSRSCYFRAYPFNRSVVSSLQVLFILSSLASVSTRVVPIPSCPLYSSFIALQPPRFTWCSLFLFSTTVLSIVFNSVVFCLSIFQPFKVHGFTRSSKKQLSLPLIFLFLFPLVPS